MFKRLTFTICLSPLFSFGAEASPKVGDAAPLFELPNQANKMFKLEERKGKGWTVLYFYPKAETPGCTKQACAFRDSINVIRALNAEVYGVSTDTVEAQAKFHEHHGLKFDLLADSEAKVTKQYDVKMPLVNISKRWTFLIDPELKVRWVFDKVDPVQDPKMVAEKLKELQAKK